MTGIAVAVHLNQAGDDRRAAKVDRLFRHIFRQNLTKLAFLHLKGAGFKRKIAGKNPRILIEHGIPPLQAVFYASGRTPAYLSFFSIEYSAHKSKRKYPED